MVIPSMKMNPWNVVDLPDDIVLAILLLLVPPRSLLRMKLVCKYWCSLIAHPDFIRIHLNHSITNKKPSILISIMIYGVNYEPGPHVLQSLNTTMMMMMMMMACDWIRSLIPRLFDREDIGVPVMDYCTSRRRRRIWDYAVWNPCTLEYLRVPYILFEGNLTFASFGFGYDATTDCYKLIQIKSFYLANLNDGSQQLINETQLLVYTLGLALEWKAIGTVPFEVSPLQVHAGLFLNGGLHWLATAAGCGRGMIICIDIASEKYREISKPEIVSISRCDMMNITTNVKLNVLKGLLCITNFVTKEKSIEVWAMKDYYCKDDEPSSWSKLFMIKEPLLYPGINYFELLSDICNKDGDEILAFVNTKRRRSLVWYNMKNDKTRTIMENHDEDGFRYLQVQTCIESLVPLNTGCYNMYSMEEMREEEKEEEEEEEEEP